MAKTRNNMREKIQPIDLSYARAATLMIPVWERLRLILVGCGGTGSWLAPSIARIARLQRDQGREVEVTFYDHDHVEAKNIPRQHFCDAELGRNKAVTLAARYSAAWGVEIAAVPKRFKAANVATNQYALTIILGCVDNASARAQIAGVVGRWVDHRMPAWWLDCGNDESSGQVIVGSDVNLKGLEDSFTPSCKICKRLPAPSLVAPDLLDPRPEELLASKLSCAEIQLANAQSLAVNQMVASVATDYLLRLVSGGLKRFATYFDLSSGSMRSRYITADEVARVVGKPASYLISEAKERRKAA
jgi:PRTRC genetic system ThiF family protein